VRPDDLFGNIDLMAIAWFTTGAIVFKLRSAKRPQRRARIAEY
jgi:hypothetical protein